MNPNEQVKWVFNGEIPDRVPIGEFAIDFDTIEKNHRQTNVFTG